MISTHKQIPPEPWHSFFLELDALAREDVRLECIGGFVVTEMYGLKRSTSDIDLFAIAPPDQGKELLAAGQKGSYLAKKYKVHLQWVGAVAPMPYNYDQRLLEMYPGVYKRLRFFVPDPYDLALSKIGRADGLSGRIWRRRSPARR